MGPFAKLLGRQGALAGHAPYRSAARKAHWLRDSKHYAFTLPLVSMRNTVTIK
jgi:hypothetical protein